jgi:hypothetical protein
VVNQCQRLREASTERSGSVVSRPLAVFDIDGVLADVGTASTLQSRPQR